MFFVGSHELTFDNKNRVSIPFAIRSKMNTDACGRGFYVVPGRRPRTLALYAEKYFEEQRQREPREPQLSDDAYDWRTLEFSLSTLVDPDAQGRILIPERLLKRAGVGREVLLIGLQDHLELWNRADFEAFEADKWSTYPQQRARAINEMQEINGQAAANGAAPPAAGPKN